MNYTICNFCGHKTALFPIHGFEMCPICKGLYPADEPEEQDLFDEEFDVKENLGFILSDLLLAV